MYIKLKEDTFMNKLEKAILFFTLFTITLMIGRHIDITSLNISTADKILLTICYGIALYSNLIMVVCNIGDAISDIIHKK